MAQGDHIKVARAHGLYSHHGIDMGDGTVVHFAGEPIQKRRARVCRVPIEEFLRGGTPKVVVYPEEERSPDEIVETALAQLDAQDYDLWRNNCEHFACYCVTGKRQSKQISRLLRAASTVAVTAVLVGGGVVISTWRRRRRGHRPA